jgi:hypothetical protein
MSRTWAIVLGVTFAVAVYVLLFVVMWKAEDDE